MEDLPLNNDFNFMCHTDALVINDSEGLFQSPKRRDITGARTYVLLSPQVGITGLEKQFSKRDYTYSLYNETYTVVARYIETGRRRKVFIFWDGSPELSAY